MTPPSDNQPSDLCADLQISLLRGQVEVLTGANRTAYLDREQLRVEIAAARAEGERAATERIAAFIEERASMLDDEMSIAVPANTTGLDRQRAVIDALYQLDVDIRAGEHLESTSGTAER